MKVVHIDELANVCGYFTTQTDANNHYGCNHPEQEEFEMLHEDEEGYTRGEFEEYGITCDGPKVKQGKCYAWSCPLATECNLEDLKEHSPEHYECWKDSEHDPSEAGANLVLVCDEELINKLDCKTV